MINESNCFWLKRVSTLFLFFLICQAVCVDSKEDDMSHSRKKREYPNSNKDSCGSSYPGGPGYKDNCSPLICKTPPKCLPPAALPNYGDPTKTNTTWLSFARMFYVTVSSCYGHSLAARILLGRDVMTGRELGEMCFTQFFATFGSVNLNYNNGFGQQFLQNCSSRSDGGTDCVTLATGGTEFIDPTLLNLVTIYPILTDGKSYVLYHRCLDGRYGDYFVFTTTPFLDKAAATEVIVLIERMGFDISQVRFQSCQNPGYPSPFQDYLDQKCASYSSTPPSTCSANPNPYTQSENYNAGPSYNSNPPYNSHGNSYDNYPHNNY